MTSPCEHHPQATTTVPAHRRQCAVPPYLLEQMAQYLPDAPTDEPTDVPADTSPPSAPGPSIRPPQVPGRTSPPPVPHWDAELPADVGRTLELDEKVRELRHRGLLPDRAITAPTGTLNRTVSDAQGTEELPGTTVRSEGEDPVEDPAVNEAYDGVGSVYAFLEEIYRQSSLDGTGLELLATVHYGRRYDNAFWDGTQMVFGDGDGEIFTGFTPSLSVIAHELAHGLMQYSTDLVYEGQSGALNESFADVLGVLVDQYAHGHTAEDATWLIGAEVFGPDVQATALRSLAAPGTAYDDPRLGKDPQPAHLDDFVETESDYGGVHQNSGIPNKAFHLAATALGGHAWERAGQVWFDVVTGGAIPADVDFAGFAEATVASARDRFGEEVAGTIDEAWRQVGVLTAAEVTA
ncbi:M4 family metallopeptidase [Citricoccus sp. GCM10030269]|uniref:M4 family metallopeptidase n=1 Tax=Citricoccus sp. GCM10030269 TaxID=3273388 RepID=UPI00360F9251